MRIVRSFIRQILRQLGFGVWKIDSSETLNFENLLYAILREHKVVSLLHIGAHDGKSFSDPLYKFVKRNRGRFYGVYVEPIKANYDLLVRNLGDVPSLNLLNVGVHPTLSSIEIHQMEGLHGPAAKQASGLSTTQRIRLEQDSLRLRPHHLSSTTVPAITVTECLNYLPAEASNAPLVICVDTEGMDFDIVRSMIPGPLRPLLIRFEHNLCDEKSLNSRETYLKIVEELNSVGYQVFTEHNDAVALHIQLVDLITKPYK